jgi:predicted nucleotidyltransferase
VGNESDHQVNADEIKCYLTELNEELRSIEIKGEICLYGGAVMALAYNARPDTDDVDAVFEPVSHIRQAARVVAQRNGLSVGWLNNAVEIFLAQHERRILIDLSHLKIYVPPPDYLLAMKVLSARADTMDQDDLKVLLRELGLKGGARVFEIVRGYYPGKEIKPETRILIEELLSAHDNG